MAPCRPLTPHTSHQLHLSMCNSQLPMLLLQVVMLHTQHRQRLGVYLKERSSRRHGSVVSLKAIGSWRVMVCVLMYSRLPLLKAAILDGQMLKGIDVRRRYDACSAQAAVIYNSWC